MTEENISYAEAARTLETTPIEAMAWLQIFGMVSDQTSIPLAMVRAAAAKMGLAPKVEAGNSQGSRTDAATPEQIAAVIHADTHRRRRFLRALLHKMDRHGYWHPSAARSSSLRHGFGEPEAGWVRIAIEALEKAGWLESGGMARRDHKDVPIGLAGEKRSEIMRFILTGMTTDPALVQFLAV